MKRSASLLLLLVFCFLSLVNFGEGIAGTLQDVRRRGKLIAGVKTEYPPLGFLDNKGINKGFDVDIAKTLAKELFGKEGAVEFVPVMPENQIAFLTSLWWKVRCNQKVLITMPSKMVSLFAFIGISNTGGHPAMKRLANTAPLRGICGVHLIPVKAA